MFPRLIFLLLIAAATRGQTCMHTDLSNKFDIKTNVRRIVRVNDPDYLGDSAIITVTIIDKLTKRTVQTISFRGLFFDTVMKNCNFVRSYTTGKNENAEVTDNMFGDIVVADLNFDGEDDIAIIGDSGGNGGPVYRYYLQKNGKFVISNYLTENVGQFPSMISSKRHTITTLVHANVGQRAKKTFRYDTATGKWKLIKWTMVE